MKSLEHEVLDAEKRLRVAMLTNDVAALADLIHDDIVFTGPDGAIVRKQDDLAAHAAGRLRLTRPSSRSVVARGRDVTGCRLFKCLVVDRPPSRVCGFPLPCLPLPSIDLAAVADGARDQTQG